MLSLREAPPRNVNHRTSIRQYPFRAASVGIEAKGLDYLWEKAGKTAEVHRAEFYHFLWIEEGGLRLELDFEEIAL